MERDVIGIAKEGTRCLYYMWLVLNKSGRKRNGEGVTQGECENTRSLVGLWYINRLKTTPRYTRAGV